MMNYYSPATSYSINVAFPEQVSSPIVKDGFFSQIQEQADQLRSEGRHRTADTYLSALRSFQRFRGYRDLKTNEMTQILVLEYEHWLKTRGVCRNTSSFYMRILRAAYNRATLDRAFPAAEGDPFRHVYTGVDKTAKRAISLTVIRKIKRLDLSDSPHLNLARDLFLFSFYTRGMSFIDMAYLKKTDVRDGTLLYFRKKTGQPLRIRWEGCMQEIVDKYKNPQSPFLLPILTADHASDKSGQTDATRLRRMYVNALHKVNENLKMISDRLHLDTPLSTYVARHSWASIAQRKQIPISIISASMGHHNETTTRIYLDSIDPVIIDQANHMILKELS